MSEWICEITEYRSSFGESFTWATEYKEPIVRCRDCKHWATEARFTGMCVGKRFNPDGFCAWGERRES